MKGIGLHKTIYKDMELVDIVNLDINKIRLSEAYGFTKSDENIVGTGILVCYSGDLNDILKLYPGLKPINASVFDGVISRMILPNGIAALKLTNIICYDDIANSNFVNAYNNGVDLIHIRKDFDKLVDKDLFYDTILPKQCYDSLKSLFHGGVMNARLGVYSNVKSGDLVSAHAANMINNKYPLGRFEPAYRSLESLRQIRKLKDIFYIGNVTFKNLRLKPGYIGIIYVARDVIKEGNNIEVTQSGYLVNAERITISITETYMECIEMCYDFDKAEVAPGEYMYWCLNGGYLPDNVRKHIYNKFQDKQTQPKGTKAYEEAKVLVNMCYGFMCRGTEDYNHYSKGHKLVYPYQWGVYTCLYTTYKIVKAMNDVIKKGGKVVALATDSIKYIGDDLNWGTELGEMKYEAKYKRACIHSAYRAIYIKDNNELEIKLAGCLKEKAKKYFSTHSVLDIFSSVKIPNGSVSYEYNPKTSRIESVFSDYTMGTCYI